jgi:hypothetical protein
MEFDLRKSVDVILPKAQRRPSAGIFVSDETVTVFHEVAAGFVETCVCREGENDLHVISGQMFQHMAETCPRSDSTLPRSLSAPGTLWVVSRTGLAPHRTSWTWKGDKADITRSV